MNDDEKRINIEDLPKAAEELTDEEAKNVAGGTTPANNSADSFYGTGVYKTTDAGLTTAGNTIGGSITVDPKNRTQT